MQRSPPQGGHQGGGGEKVSTSWTQTQALLASQAHAVAHAQEALQRVNALLTRTDALRDGVLGALPPGTSAPEWLFAHSVMGAATSAADAASAAVLRAHGAIAAALGVAHPTPTTALCVPLTCRPCMPVGVTMPLGVAVHADVALPCDAWAVWGRGTTVAVPHLHCDEATMPSPSLSAGGRASRQSQVAAEGLLALCGSPGETEVQGTCCEADTPTGPALKPPPMPPMPQQQLDGWAAPVASSERMRRVQEAAPRVSSASAGGPSVQLDAGGGTHEVGVKRTTGADRAARFEAKFGSDGQMFEGLHTARKSRKLMTSSSAGGADAGKQPCVLAKGPEVPVEVAGGLYLWSLPQLRDAFAGIYGRKSTSKNKEWLVRRLRERGFTGAGALEQGAAGAAETETCAADEDDSPEDTVCGGDGDCSSDEEDVAPHLCM